MAVSITNIISIVIIIVIDKLIIEYSPWTRGAGPWTAEPPCTWGGENMFI